MNIEGAELTVYLTDGNQISIDLESYHVKAIADLLKIKITNVDAETYNVNMVGPKTIENLYKMNGNPLNLNSI